MIEVKKPFFKQLLAIILIKDDFIKSIDSQRSILNI